ncbi:MAG: hypothetical protein ACOH1X_08540 [Kaistella sp.]
MKNILIFGIAILTLTSCGSKKAANSETLPKDIALKPDNILSQQQDKERLSIAIKEIDSLISRQTCTDSNDWNFAAIGAKPCGGPSSYIAYPKKTEAEILPKIERFTAMQSAFNTKYKLMSDCMLVQPPSGIRCKNGKAVLESLGSNVEVQ